MTDTQHDAGALTVGICGLGAMGTPMAARLVQSHKFERVVLYNRTVTKAVALQKSLRDDQSADSEKSISIEVAESVSAFVDATLGTSVVMMLHGDDATADFVDSYIEASIPRPEKARTLGTLLVNSATISETCVLKINDKLTSQKQLNFGFVNAAVTGRPEHVARGQLCVWVSCASIPTENRTKLAACGERLSSPATFVQNHVAPAYAKAAKIISLSDVAASARYKICTNFLVYGVGELIGEALVLLDENGLDRETLLHWTGNVLPPGNIVDLYARKMVHREFGDHGETVGAALEVAFKDLKFMRSSLDDQCAKLDKGESQAGSTGSEGKMCLPVLDATLMHVEHQITERKEAGKTNAYEWCSLLEQIEKRKKRRLK